MRAFGVFGPGPRWLVGLAVALCVTVALAATLCAAEGDLTIGDTYRVNVQRAGVTRSYEGTLIKVTEKWLVLNSVAQQESKQGVPLLMDLPGAGKWFSRETTTHVEVDSWIPFEAATIETHKPAAGTGKTKSLEAAEPPVRRVYIVNLLVDGKLAERRRDLLRISGDAFWFGPSNASPTARETVKRSEILALHFARYDEVARK